MSERDWDETQSRLRYKRPEDKTVDKQRLEGGMNYRYIVRLRNGFIFLPFVET